MKKITTVCGEISPEDLGYTSMHEHTLLTMAPLFGMPRDKAASAPAFTLESATSLKASNGWMATREELMYDDTDCELKELEAFGQVGGRALLDCSYTGDRLDIRDTRALSVRSGIHIVACTGFFSEATYPKGFDPLNREQIRQWELREIQTGIDGTDVRPGCIKVGFGPADLTGAPMSEHELSVLRASCSVAAETGYPIAIHGSFVRENLLRILDIAIGECGVRPDKIDVCHLDSYITGKAEHPDLRAFVKDPNHVIERFTEFACRVLDKGVSVNFDGWAHSTPEQPLTQEPPGVLRTTAAYLHCCRFWKRAMDGRSCSVMIRRADVSTITPADMDIPAFQPLQYRRWSRWGFCGRRSGSRWKTPPVFWPMNDGNGPAASTAAAYHLLPSS